MTCLPGIVFIYSGQMVLGDIQELLQKAESQSRWMAEETAHTVLDHDIRELVSRVAASSDMGRAILQGFGSSINDQLLIQHGIAWLGISFFHSLKCVGENCAPKRILRLCCLIKSVQVAHAYISICVLGGILLVLEKNLLLKLYYLSNVMDSKKLKRLRRYSDHNVGVKQLFHGFVDGICYRRALGKGIPQIMP